MRKVAVFSPGLCLLSRFQLPTYALPATKPAAYLVCSPFACRLLPVGLLSQGGIGGPHV